MGFIRPRCRERLLPLIVRISATHPRLAGTTIVVVRRLRRLLRGSLLARDGLLMRLLLRSENLLLLRRFG